MTDADLLHTDLPALWEILRGAAGGPDPSEGQPPLTNPAVSGIPLDPDQQRAADHFRGPIRVLAPAGSGKTRTLTGRASSLVQRGIPEAHILALAFNNKAAAEMASRLDGLGVQGVHVRTFHALGYEIVQAALGWEYTADSGTQLHALMKQVLDEQALTPKAGSDINAFVEAAQMAKASLTPFAEMEVFDGDAFHPLEAVFRRLLAWQTAARLLTFEDMIYFALRLLIDDPVLRTRWQGRFAFLLVDEFQDLNAAQMLLVRLLALPHNNLFVVGDDDQLIYAWRGADVRHTLDFGQIYPGAASVVLGTNYRSGSRLVRHAGWLIARNRERVAKDILPRPDAPRGRLELRPCDDLAQQAEAAATWIANIHEERGIPWGQFGFLFRVNADAQPLIRALTGRSIPFTSPGEPDPESGDPPPEMAPERVTLLTIHKAKGMEFPFVVYFNLSHRAGTRLTEADERRVAYVGVTRAQEGLLITADRAHPSAFLTEYALNPAFADYGTAYLERQLNILYRQAWRREHSGLWNALKSLRATPPDGQLFLDDEMDLIDTEIRFRRLLNFEPEILRVARGL